MKKGDRAMLMICAVLALIAALFFAFRAFAPPPREKIITVAVNGEVIDAIHIASDSEPFERTYQAEGSFNTVRAEGGRVAVVSADCRDQLCVRHGWLTRPGDSSVCLPNRLIVRVTGVDKTGDIDGGTW